MKALLDCFLDLPSWQGSALLVGVVALPLLVGWIAFHVGRRIEANRRERISYLARVRRTQLSFDR